METTIITLGGQEHKVAALKALQCAEFIDELELGNAGESTVAIFSRSLRIIARSLKNAGSPLADGVDEDALIAKINEQSKLAEIEPAFRAVIEISGLAARPAAVEIDSAPQLIAAV